MLAFRRTSSDDILLSAIWECRIEHSFKIIWHYSTNPLVNQGESNDSSKTYHFEGTCSAASVPILEVELFHECCQ